MNRNGRRIALSMVAIVLGAGYLMKVIPPETDIGLNDSHSISIDGALVSNPLDLAEAPRRFPTFVSTILNPDGETAPASEPEPQHEAPTSVPSNLDPLPAFPFVNTGGSEPQPSMPSEAAGPATDFPSDFNVPPTLPPVGEVAINGSAPGNGWAPAPSGSNPSPGSPPAQNPGTDPGNGPIVVPPFVPSEPDSPESPPNIDLPLDPQGPGPKGPAIDDPKFTDTLPDPWTPPDSPTDTDVPSHQVPDSGVMLTMLSFSLVLLTALRKPLDRLKT